MTTFVSFPSGNIRVRYISRKLIENGCAPSMPTATAIRTSSFVSLSNLLSASSMSVFPINFFRYFSEKFLNQQQPLVQESHTYTALFHLFRSNPKNRKHLDHYLHNDINHFTWR